MTLENGKKDLLWKIIIPIASLLIGYGVNSIFVAGRTIQKVESLQTEIKEFKENDFTDLKKIVYENSKQISSIASTQVELQKTVAILLQKEINRRK